VPAEDKPQNLTHVDDPSTFYKGIKGFWASKGETLLPKALEKNIRYAKLLSLNDLPDAALPTDMFIFTEKKRKIGTEEFHVVKDNENMLLISQKEAILLSSLYALNNLVPGQEPETGERLTLQYKSYETPKTKQQFLNALESNRSSEAVISKVEKKSITESVPALSSLPKETQQVLEKEKVNTPPPSPKQNTAEVSITTVKTEPLEPQQTPPAEKVKETTTTEIATPVKTTPDPVAQTKVTEKQTAPEKQQIQEEPAPVQENNTKTEPPGKNDIINEDKARKMDQLLNSQPLEKASESVIIPEPKKNQNTSSSPFGDRNNPETVKKQEPEPVEVAVPAATAIKRTYDEPDVNDSVKALKKKFDQIVYSPRPPRRIDTTKRIVPVVTKPVTITKEEEKKSNVQVTKTGIKRDLSKTGNQAKEIKKTDNKKKATENTKKGSNKKSAAAEKKAAAGKKNNTKKAAATPSKSGGKKSTKKK
jgi:hypothetical protein